VTQSFAPAAESVGVQVRLERPTAPLRVRADRERLQQMLGAFVDNALRYTPAAGEVVLEGRARDGLVELAVRDSGSGIPPADLAHVFERFYRADPSRQRASGTSGLGLSIVRALAEAQGGRVEASNVEPHGARFAILLPVA